MFWLTHDHTSQTVKGFYDRGIRKKFLAKREEKKIKCAVKQLGKAVDGFLMILFRGLIRHRKRDGGF